MPYKVFDMPKYPCVCDMWDKLASETRPIVVYGMGNGADKLLKRFEKYGITVSDFFASDGFVRGHSFHGKRVKSFCEIKEQYADFVIVLSFATKRQEVLQMLDDIDARYEMYVPDMPVCREEEYFDREFFNANYKRIVRACDCFADEDSKNAYRAIINYKLSGKMHYLLDAYSEKEEMYSLLDRERVLSYLDLGAYNGDTLREATEFFPNIERACLVEPDRKNFAKLHRFTETLDDIEVRAINAAVWSESRAGAIFESGNRNSTVCATASYENKEETIDFISVDSLGLDTLDFVKYDVEGAEYEGLVGAQETIKRLKPQLLVSLYHKSEDIFAITEYLCERYSDDYDFYLRRVKCVPAWEINLIMTRKA